MDGDKPEVDGKSEDLHPKTGMNVLTISLIFCCMVTLLNILYLYPEMQERADCADECNAALQKMYDSCVIQNGIAPNVSFIPDLPEETYPAPVYTQSEAVCMELLDNGTLVEAECP